MTPEERKKLEDRLNAAANANQRINELQAAISHLNGSTKRISVSISPSIDRNLYASNSPDRNNEGWFVICHYSQEPGINEEIKLAVLAILQLRLEKAKQQYEKS